MKDDIAVNIVNGKLTLLGNLTQIHFNITTFGGSIGYEDITEQTCENLLPEANKNNFLKSNRRKRLLHMEFIHQSCLRYEFTLFKDIPAL